MTHTIAIVSTWLVTLWCCVQIGPVTTQQLVPASPCPNVLRYEPRPGGRDQDRWYGVVTLQSEAELSGVWLRLYFDKPSLQLGNWFGEIVPMDNHHLYVIKNPQHTLKANVPERIRFFVRYASNQASEPPQITRVALNGKTICEDSSKIQTTTPYSGEPITSAELATFTTHRPSTTQRPKRPVEEFGQFFQGDFNFFGNQHRPFLEAQCGSIVIPPRPLITNGQATQEGEFPWHVALYHIGQDSDSQTNQKSGAIYICGGSLVSRSHVITAAHCVTVQRSHAVVSGQSLRAYFGKYYLNDWANPGIQSRQPKDIIPHPQYDAEKYSNDIAVLKMATPVDITNYVRPVCLWSGSKPDLLEERTGVVVGWGFDEYGRVSEELRKAEMPVVPQATCIYSLVEFFARFTSSKTFCAGFRNGTSVCSGDSGGGMVFPQKKTTGGNDNNSKSTVWELRGVVSLSVALQSESLKCDTSHYAVFTDVAKYSDWIKENMT